MISGGFQIMTFMSSVERVQKEECTGGRGFQVLSFELIEQSYCPEVYISASQQQVSQEFLHQS